MQIFVAVVVVLYKGIKENAKKNPMIGGFGGWVIIRN